MRSDQPAIPSQISSHIPEDLWLKDMAQIFYHALHFGLFRAGTQKPDKIAKPVDADRHAHFGNLLPDGEIQACQDRVQPWGAPDSPQRMETIAERRQARAFHSWPNEDKMS